MIQPRLTIDLTGVGNNAVFPLGGRSSLASVSANPHGAAWGTAVITPKWSNNPAGPWNAFAAGELSTPTIGPGAGVISWINVQAKGFLAIEVTTAEGATEFADVYVVDDSDA